MNKNIILIGIILGIILTTGCVQQQVSEEELSILKTEPVDLSSVQTEKLSFINYYSLNPLNVTLQVPQYNLPLNADEISNFNDFSTKIPLDEDASRLLEKNGFVVTSNPFNPGGEYITEPYKTLKEKKIPIFITSDSLLHLYHIQFDETLRQIEEREFYDTIWEISKELLNDSIDDYNNYDGDLKEASRRNVAYFAVGLSLLQPREEQLCKDEWKCRDPGLASAYFEPEDLKKYHFEVPDFVESDVEKELELIEKHAGFSESPIFIYKEDYSQYVPRGHYTRSEKLKNYFKAFMWYGRISFLLKGGCPDCLVSAEDAKLQTIGVSLIASEFAENQELKDKWDRIYSVTAFYVGLSDDLGPYEYMEALDSVVNGKFPDSLTDENIGELKAKLAEYSAPKIYGGTGDCVIPPPFTPEQADQCLENTKGFRLMGQRFIPDSYMFSNLVGAYTDVYQGDREPKPFTFVISGAGRPIRGFPRGLDVMALLGSDRARELLDELDDSNYKRYDEAYKKLEDEFDSFNETEWNKNLYWSWLFALKPLLKEYGTGYPTFMQTGAWQDKELTTALASWAELRHDTILYAKQSYTMAETAIPMPTPEKPVVGYVEPVPEFYNRLLALTRMTATGLDEMNVLDSSAKYRLENLETILELLVELSGKELENEKLTEEDYEFIENFGDELNAVISEVDEKAKKTTIIADVHTDGNTGQVLEEGVGYVDLIVVAYKVPDGRILIGAGPVMSYYEFKQPMAERLTDEKWREMLGSEAPKRPEWYFNFAE
jgi:hypothetical protein